MAGAARFVVGVAWGAFSAQLFLQAVTSLVICAFYLSAIFFSDVRKTKNAIGACVALSQALLFGLMFVFGNWISYDYIDFDNRSNAAIAGMATFVLAIVFMLPQIPGKLTLARMSAWLPNFIEAANVLPPGRRMQFARKARRAGKVV